jgi:hypothetical protein
MHALYIWQAVHTGLDKDSDPRYLKLFIEQSYLGEGQTLIFTLILNPEPNLDQHPLLFSEPDPAPLK